jgi:pyridoxal phosphate enzyme (YggS family)
LACQQLGQHAFGENYVQEALLKMQALSAYHLEWHLIGPLQSNKCKAVAEHFDWVHTLDREKSILALQRHRPKHLPLLNVLIQVNIDGQLSKSGCTPSAVLHLAQLIAAATQLRLRGLMAIPDPDPNRKAEAFAAMRTLFQAVQTHYAGIDTLSMGMSDDFPLAIAHGANLVRIGSALFGARQKTAETTCTPQ